jgi:hypothetical protein
MYLQMLYTTAGFLALAAILTLVIWVVRRRHWAVIMVAMFESLLWGFVSLSAMGGEWLWSLLFGPDPTTSLVLWVSQLSFLIWALQEIVKRAWNGELKDLMSKLKGLMSKLKGLTSNLTEEDLLLIKHAMNRLEKKEQAARKKQGEVAGNEPPISSDVA